MIVIGIISIALAFLVPALAPASGRALDGSARLLAAELENARQIAIAERTRTRVLVPDLDNCGNPTSFGTGLGLRAYTTVSLNKTASPPTWKQRGKWNRLAQSASFDPNPLPLTAQEMNVIGIRKSTVTAIDNSATGNAASNNFTGAYIEFRANGATSLDPTSPNEVMVLADGIADGTGNMTKKNQNLKYRITIDPLTGSATLQ